MWKEETSLNVEGGDIVKRILLYSILQVRSHCHRLYACEVVEGYGPSPSPPQKTKKKPGLDRVKNQHKLTEIHKITTEYVYITVTILTIPGVYVNWLLAVSFKLSFPGKISILQTCTAATRDNHVTAACLSQYNPKKVDCTGDSGIQT